MTTVDLKTATFRRTTMPATITIQINADGTRNDQRHGNGDDGTNVAA